jgi:hypothetical protein
MGIGPGRYPVDVGNGAGVPVAHKR